MRLQNYMNEKVSTGFNYQLIVPAIRKLKPVRKNTTNKKHFINKPDNGLWTSTLYKSHLYGNSSAWRDFAEKEGIGNIIYDGTVLEIQKGVSMYIIDNKEHFQKLLKNFPYKVNGKVFIDFVKFSKIYDALYVTKKGVSQNRFIDSESNLYGWDVESTVWFNTKYLKIIGNK